VIIIVVSVVTGFYVVTVTQQNIVSHFNQIPIIPGKTVETNASLCFNYVLRIIMMNWILKIVVSFCTQFMPTSGIIVIKKQQQPDEINLFVACFIKFI
jgi:hypothetical protein